MAEEAKKAAPKRKTAAKTAAKTAPKTTAKRKAAAKTTARRKTAAKSNARRAAASRTPRLQDRVTEAGRSAFLASLGFYGMAFDQMQEQLKTVEDELTARRKKADKLYQNMVKRGEKVEKQARSAIDDLELPKLDVAVLDRAKLEARLEKARARFEELKQTAGLKSVA